MLHSAQERQTRNILELSEDLLETLKTEWIWKSPLGFVPLGLFLLLIFSDYICSASITACKVSVHVEKEVSNHINHMYFGIIMSGIVLYFLPRIGFFTSDIWSYTKCFSLILDDAREEKDEYFSSELENYGIPAMNFIYYWSFHKRGKVYSIICRKLI